MDTHRILIIGANGFVGKQLVSMLSQRDKHVIALSYSAPSTVIAEHLQCDIRNADALQQAIHQAAPTQVIHLAARCHVPSSFADPQGTWETNVMGSINILTALQRHAPDAFTVFVSSAEVYGGAFKRGALVSEQTPCLPLNPYAASKLAAEIAFQEHFRRGFTGVIARPFNHIGPGQSPDFVTASFAQQIARIEAGLQPPKLKVGNLDASRDFLDVLDVCEAYASLLGLTGEERQYSRCFNVASGKPRSISSILNTLLSLSKASIELEPDPQRMRPSDLPTAAGDSSALISETGWRPQRDLETTLEELLEYWRNKVRNELE